MSDEGVPTRLILDGISRVERTLSEFQARVNNQLDGLDARFLPRQEFTVRFERAQQDRTELQSRLATEESDRVADVQRVASRIDMLEERRASERRFVITSLIAVAGLLLTVIAIVATHWH